jgi:hypothetical protein
MFLSIGVKGSKICWRYNKQIIIKPLVYKGTKGLNNKRSKSVNQNNGSCLDCKIWIIDKYSYPFNKKRRTPL